MRVLATAWAGGGLLVGIAASAYLWRTNLSQPFLGLAIGGGLLLAVAVAWLAALAAARGSRLAVVGLIAVAAGVLAGFFGGLVLVAPGAALYILGVHRGRILQGRALVTAVVLLVLAVATIPLGADEIVGIELAAAAAIATGLGLSAASAARRSRPVG
jgi:hypothetical protein